MSDHKDLEKNRIDSLVSDLREERDPCEIQEGSRIRVWQFLLNFP